jgi:hypothetical protein
VYQEFQNVTVAPDSPDLNCCLVGPAFHIQDYPVDKDDISVGNFVKTGFTADAPCLADGSSAGKPDNGASFLTLANPPNHTAGGLLDADSVIVTFDDLYIDLNHGTGGTATLGVNGFGASGDFVNKKVKAGDRLIMTHASHAGDTSWTVVKMVKEVTDGTNLLLTTTFKQADIDKVNSTGILWRVEHQLDDQAIDTVAYTTIVGNAITIKTGSNGIRLVYESSSWAVNYAKMYVGYRELRTDLQDVKTVNSVDSIASIVGRIDERNPLAAGCQVAMANTGTPIQIFGVKSDDLTGHASARDRMASRSDIYAIVPMTDSISGADWVTIVAMWKAHCVAFEDPDKSKFRVVLGSYDELPTEKSSCAPSIVGYTLPKSPSTDPYDVLVDPAVATTFVTKGVSADHVLDVSRASDAALNNLTSGLHIFSSTYAGAKGLRGAIGEKRIRTTDASKWAGGHAAEACCYAVRPKILRGEGGTPKVALTAVAIGTSAGSVSLTKTGGFAGVAAGDVVHVQGAGNAAYNGGWLCKTPGADTIVLELVYGTTSTDASNVDVYQPLAYGVGGTAATGPNKITKTGAFASGVAAGDVLYVLRDTGQVGNVGMWVITTVISADEVRVAAGASNLTGSTTTDFAVFSTAQSNGSATVTVRQRLTRLRDDTATFLTTVNPGEDIEIPYPAVSDPTKWDTTVTQWQIDAIVSDELLDADLDDLEELAPKNFVAGYAGDCAYRINIDLNPDSQIEELNTITTSLKNHRCVMVWPNECYVSNLQNELTQTQNKQSGQYLACTVGGMVAGLPSHQGLSFLGVAGVQQIFNSNFYFTDDQLTDLRNGGWYVFVQDSETSLPYTIHEVTTDVSAYAFGEFMNVKNYDFISLYLKDIMLQFPGRYNIYEDTLNIMKGSLEAGVQYLKLRIFPKIGAPLIDAVVDSVAQLESEVDRVEAYVEVDLPKVLNRIGLHLRS